jgi:hypothetical protein
VTLEPGGKTAAILLDDVALPQRCEGWLPSQCRSPAKSDFTGLQGLIGKEMSRAKEPVHYSPSQQL